MASTWPSAGARSWEWSASRAAARPRSVWPSWACWVGRGASPPVRSAWTGELIGLGRASTARRSCAAARLTFVPQDPFRSFDPLRRMGPQVRRPLELHRGLSRGEADERVADLLARLGVAQPDAVMERYPHQLSGGLLQRAAIATALSCGPELVVADEPTTALDALVQVQVIESFLALVRELGTSLLVITHDLRLLERMADRIAAMYAGRIVEFGPAATAAAQRRATPTRPRSWSHPSWPPSRASACPPSRASRRRCPARSRPAPSRRAARVRTSAASHEAPAYPWPANRGRGLPPPHRVGSAGGPCGVPRRRGPDGGGSVIGPALSPRRARRSRNPGACASASACSSCWPSSSSSDRSSGRWTPPSSRSRVSASSASRSMRARPAIRWAPTPRAATCWRASSSAAA